jgi:competence protein ComEC
VNQETEVKKSNRLLLIASILVFLFGLRLFLFPVSFDTKSTTNNSIDTVNKPVSPPSQSPGYFSSLRGYLASKLDALYPPEEANLVKGLLLGVNDFSKSAKAQFINTGTIHVVVVSGYNITLVASVILSSSLVWGRKVALGLSFLGIILYTLLTGAQPPAVRAAIMGSLAFGALGLGRQKEGMELLLIAGGLMLLFDPKLLTSISFQLSYLATLGVIYFNPKIEPRIKKFGPLKGDLANTLSAQILVAPLLFFYFGQISWISPLANLLVLWTVPIATILGFLSLLLALVIPLLGQLVAWFNFVFLLYFMTVVKTLASVPIIKIPDSNLPLLVGYFLIVIGLITFKRDEKG